MIIESIISILSQAGISNVYPVFIPQNKSLPAACVFVVGDNPNPTKHEVSKINELTIQVSCVADTYADCIALDAQIKTALDGYDGIVDELDIDIDYDTGRDVPTSEAKQFHWASDYKIMQKSGVATYSLTFTVTGDGAVLPGANIVLLGGYEIKTTDSNGEVVYYNLPAGTYNFMIVYGGEVKRTDSVTITDSNATYEYNIGVYPVDYLTNKYDPNVTFESGGTTYMRDLRGNKDVPIVGTDGSGNTIYDFSPLSDYRLNKNAYVGNSYGLPEYYNSPWDDYFYYDSAHPYYWTLPDFHRHYLENQIIDSTVNDNIFLNARAVSSTELPLSETIELFIYSQSLTDTDLSTILTYIGIQDDFYGDEMFDNYDFSTGNTTGWNFVDCTGNVGTYLGKNNVCLVTATNITTIYPRQFKTLTLNKTYRIEIEYYIPSSNGFTFDVRYGTSGQVLCKSDILDSWTNEICESKLTNIGDTGFVSLYRISASIGNVFYLKKVSIKEKYENYYKS